MPFDRRNHLLPLWDSSSSIADTEKPEETQMILISVPPALESALRAVVRWGVCLQGQRDRTETRVRADERPPRS